jgi:hypothetical protein
MPNALKIYFWAFMALALGATIWMDQWLVSVGVGFLTCVLGALAATHPTKATDPKRKEYKHIGIVLMLYGSVMSLLAIVDKFVLPYFIR